MTLVDFLVVLAFFAAIGVISGLGFRAQRKAQAAAAEAAAREAAQIRQRAEEIRRRSQEALDLMPPPAPKPKAKQRRSPVKSTKHGH